VDYTTAVSQSVTRFADRQGSNLMPKVLCILGMVVAGLLLVMFGLDLAIKFPFGGASALVSVGFIVASLILIYLSWSTFREQT
jgi:hypothetical protein